MKCPVMSYVRGFGVTLGSLLYRISGLCFCVAGEFAYVFLWNLLALGWCLVSVEAFDELLSINVPWTQEFSGVLRIWA